MPSCPISASFWEPENPASSCEELSLGSNISFLVWVLSFFYFAQHLFVTSAEPASSLADRSLSAEELQENRRGGTRA